jgi:predicted RNA binding protein YcfA (HicA-like mRNA interferase family)
LKRHELIGHLQRQGCRIDREGGRHPIYTNPANGAKAPVPRHADIDNRLALQDLSTARDHPDPLSALRFMGSMSFPGAGIKNMQILVYNGTDRWSGYCDRH